MSTETASLAEAQPNAPADKKTPRPVAPLGGVPIDAAAAIFAWDEVPGARSYRVAIAADPHFADDVVELNAGSALSLTLFSALPASGAQYYWRVRAENGPWSPFGRFQAATDREVDVYEAQQEAQTRRIARPAYTPSAPGASTGTGFTPASAVAGADLVPYYQQSYADSGDTARQLLLWVALMLLTFLVALSVAFFTVASHLG